jgi:hypothetical protein
MEDINITRDGRYIQMFNKIVDLNTNLAIDIENPNPIMICEMYKNQFMFSQRHNLLEGVDLFVKMKKLIYPLLENNSHNIMEYEVRYGNSILLESTNPRLTQQYISESWDFVKLKIAEAHPIILEGLWDDIKTGAGNVWNKTKEVAGNVWDKTKQVAGQAWEGIKSAASWVIDKGLPWFMEKLEKFMLSPIGIGLDVALTAIGVGKLATGIIWGVLTIWKIYQLATGKIPANSVWSYIDIAICLVGVIFSGAAKGLKAAFEAAGGSIVKVGGKWLKPIAEMLGKGANTIINLLAKPIEWLAKLFGPTAEAMISTAKSKLTGVFTKMKSVFSPAIEKVGLGQSIKSGVTKDIVNPLRNATGAMVRKGAIKGLKTGGAFYALNKGMEYGAEKYKNYATNKQSEDIGKIAQAIPDETIKQGLEQDFASLDSRMK